MKDRKAFLKNLSTGVNVDAEIPREVRLLLDELYEMDLSAGDWREVYINLLQHLPELHDRWQVLATIYRAVELRSDFITANRVAGKILKNFDVLFEKLPGRPSYYIPSQAGRWLFESLVTPLERAEIQAEAEGHIAVVQQLSLMAFLNKVTGARV